MPAEAWAPYRAGLRAPLGASAGELRAFLPRHRPPLGPVSSFPSRPCSAASSRMSRAAIRKATDVAFKSAGNREKFTRMHGLPRRACVDVPSHVTPQV